MGSSPDSQSVSQSVECTDRQIVVELDGELSGEVFEEIDGIRAEGEQPRVGLDRIQLGCGLCEGASLTDNKGFPL